MSGGLGMAYDGCLPSGRGQRIAVDSYLTSSRRQGMAAGGRLMGGLARAAGDGGSGFGGISGGFGCGKGGGIGGSVSGCGKKSLAGSVGPAGLRLRFLSALCYLLPLACYLLLTVGCNNSVSSAYQGQYVFPAGTGAFSLFIDNDGQDARTIMPDAMPDFAMYDLAFTGTADVTVSRNSVNLSDPVYLATGPYNLLVTAYLDAGKTEPAAWGNEDGIVIDAGVGISHTVGLKVFTPDGTGYGTFAWGIDFPAGVSEASMKVTPMAANGTAEAVYFFDDAGGNTGKIGSLNLKSGYYNVLFTFKKTGVKTVEWLEILHVYQNMASPYSQVFTDDYFNNINYTVTFIFNDAVTANGQQNKIHGDLVTVIADPTRTDYTFGGWYTADGNYAAENQWDFAAQQLSGSLSLYARWYTNMAGADFTLSGNDLQYNGSSQSVAVSYADSAMDAGTAGEITVYYTGTGATTYTESETAPINAGTYEVAVTTDGGSGYSALATPIAIGTLTIEPKPLSIDGVSIAKVYDGNDSVTSLGTLTFSGFISEETAAVDTTGVTATYNSMLVGTGIAINISGDFTLTGGTADAGNYAVAQPTGVTGTITLASPVAPNAPGQGTVAHNSITLTMPTGANSLFVLEYSRSDAGLTTSNGTWQTSLTFTGLNPVTTYCFFARYKADATKNNVSASSSGVSVTTILPQQSGSPIFTAGIPATRGTQITVGAGTLSVQTDLTYTWYRSVNNTYESGTDIQVGTGTTYTPVLGDLGMYLIVVATTLDATGDGKVVTSSVVGITGEHFQFEVTVNAGNTFAIPLSGYLDGQYTVKPYNWNINWGDGNTEMKASSDAGAPQHSNNSVGIRHTYTSAGTYTITIIPNGSNDAWFSAFGFPGFVSGAGVYANRDMVTKLISPLTPLMTRTQAQLNSGTAPNYEWAGTFSSCTNITMGEKFTFSESWNNIECVGDEFANSMFGGCSGNGFTMNSVFNLPQGIVAVGNRFASGMFSSCSGNGFTMNSVFNLPQGITTVGNLFASSMFYSCSGSAFTMNSVFNLPQGITDASTQFASNMFAGCSGNAFTMNSVFNLPQEVITVGNGYFASRMFSGCSGSAFTMNSVFNLPQEIIVPGASFAEVMFGGCSGNAFTMNSVFNLPQGIVAVGNSFAASMFSGCSGASFAMSSVFNLPQRITITGETFGEFASSMFYNCSGNAFTMNSVFNLPQGITSVGDYFAYRMFAGCSGNAFTMNSVFNLPQGITTIGGSYGIFASSMFAGCSGNAFTMNSVFNLPQGIIAVGDRSFASSMFSNCSGIRFLINNVFKFPVLNQTNLNRTSVFTNTFSGLNSSTPGAPSQTRTAASIINGNPLPSSDKNTFTGSSCFSDLATIPVRWGGGAP